MIWIKLLILFSATVNLTVDPPLDGKLIEQVLLVALTIGSLVQVPAFVTLLLLFGDELSPMLSVAATLVRLMHFS